MTLATPQLNPQRLFVTGLMGCGKTSVSKKLARILGYTPIEMDSVIVERAGGLSIREIFAQYGEDTFRLMEASLVRELCMRQGNMVVSTGGGTVCYYGNTKFMKAAGSRIYLKGEPKLLAMRIEQDAKDTSKPERPLTREKTGTALVGFLREKLGEREEFYEQADIIVEVTPEKTVDMVIEEIRGKLPCKR